MPLYGTDAAIKELLRPTTGTAFSADESARLVNLRKWVSLAIEDRTASIFGDSTTEIVEIDGDGDSVLFLPKGLRSVTSIQENPTTWSGSAWSGGTTLATTDYRLSGRVEPRTADAASAAFYRKLLRVNGSWSGLYVVTGVWQDRYPTVPDDITYVANRVAAEVYKGENASPHGLVGPDLAMVPIRKAMEIDEIKRTLDKYTVGPALMVV